MATKGKWQISKDFPKTQLTENNGNYRISADDTNKSSITILNKIHLEFELDNKLQAVKKTIAKEDLIDSGEMPRGLKSYLSHYFIDYKEEHVLNPGCTFDMSATTIFITSDKFDSKLSGTFEIIK